MGIKSEDHFLELVDRHFPNVHEHMRLGRGDDCAELVMPQDVCMTTDLFLEDVHFRRAYFQPQDIGYKALAVNISDILGMGGRPLGFSLGLFAPTDVPVEWWDAFLAGMGALAAEYNLPLTGGDLSVGPMVGVNVSIWGEKLGQSFLRRGSTHPGDALFCIGEIGLARTGLLALEESGPQASEQYPQACAAHLHPRLCPKDLEKLLELGSIHALMDLSDGLARDLPRLVARGQGVNLTIPAESLHPELHAYASCMGADPCEFAVRGGEDYALLGSIAPNMVSELQIAVPHARVIGYTTEHAGMQLNGRAFSHAGFDHFQRA